MRPYGPTGLSGMAAARLAGSWHPRGVRPPLRVAVAQPECDPGHVAENAARHAAAVRSAAVRLIVFPELSLTGYDVEAADVKLASPDLEPIIDACRETGSTALVGAPVRLDGARRIAQLAVTGAGARVAYCKTFLGGEEPSTFRPGFGPAIVEVDGWRVGVGICKDTRIEAHIRGTLALGIDLYAAGLVHAHDEVDELDERAARIVHEGSVPVAFAGAAGAAGTSNRGAAGHSAIWGPTGAILVRAGDDSGAVVMTDLHP